MIESEKKVNYLCENSQREIWIDLAEKDKHVSRREQKLFQVVKLGYKVMYRRLTNHHSNFFIKIGLLYSWILEMLKNRILNSRNPFFDKIRFLEFQHSNFWKNLKV